MEIANVFEHISKDKFKSAANKLIVEFSFEKTQRYRFRL